MRRLVSIAFVLMIGLATLSGACFAADALKHISTGGITVYYPEGLDAQAKKVMAIAQQTIKPSVEIHKQTAALLSDTDAMAKDITTALGVDEKKDTVKNRLEKFKNKSVALAAGFSNIRLVRKANATATEGIDAGVIQLRYVKDKDQFSMQLDEQDVSPDKLKKSFYPIIVNGDGSIRGEDKLGQMALDFLGSGEAMTIAPVQDTISYLIAEPLKVYHPLTRWFNEGVSGWLTRQMVAKYSPKLGNITKVLFTVSPKSKDLRGKVNLLAWPQSAYQNRNKLAADAELEVAQSQYAVEAINDLLAKAGPQSLAKIMGEINYGGNPSTEAICAAIQKVTGVDFKATLLSYVPQEVRDGMNSGEAAKLTAQAEQMAGEKKWTEAAEVIRKALAIAPDDANARMNLSWIERETGDRLDSELQLFLTGALLKQQKYSFHMYAYAVEAYYVMGRLAIMTGDLGSAKELLDTVLKFKPNHADALRAVEDIRKLEDATKPK